MPDTCTYDTYVGGIGCKFQLDDPLSNTKIQIGMDKCPNSYLPYVSISCRGPYCPFFGSPCADTNVNSNSDCGGQSSGLVCREAQPQTDLTDQVRPIIPLLFTVRT
jgi:hypothetical protein